MIEQIKNQWFYIKLSEDVLVYTKFNPVTVKGEKYVQQVLIAVDPMLNGVYLLKDYEFESTQDKNNKKPVLHLTLTEFDLILSYSEGTYEESVQGLGLVSDKEMEQLDKWQHTDGPEELSELVVSYNQDQYRETY